MEQTKPFQRSTRSWTPNAIWGWSIPLPRLAVRTLHLDGQVLAYDAESGKRLWKDGTGKAIGGGVISYSAGGKQYVAAAAGLNSAIWPVKGGPASLYVYALP